MNRGSEVASAASKRARSLFLTYDKCLSPGRREMSDAADAPAGEAMADESSLPLNNVW